MTASGEIDADEFYKLILDCLGEKDNNDASMISEIQEFMNSLDKDGNGRLDLDEFVAFVVSKLATTPEQRRKFAEQSRLHAKLSDVIIALVDKVSETLGKGDNNQLGKSMYSDLPEKMERRIAFAVEKLYSKYDKDNSHAIDSSEFFLLLCDVMKPEDSDDESIDLLPKEEDSEHFIKVITDSNREVGGMTPGSSSASELKRQDFIKFAVQVLTSSSQQRITFAAQSRMHHKLLSFFLVLILDSLETVDSEIVRAEFEKKEARARDAKILAAKKKEEEDAQKAAAMQAEALRKADLERAAIVARVEAERKQAETENSNLEEKTDTYDNEIDEDELLMEKELLAELEDFDDFSKPVTSVPEDPVQRLELLVSRLDDYTSFAWSKYDIDRDGSLNADEFEMLLRDITGRADTTSEDCRRFLRQMDQSGDGLIQREELVQFAASGFEMDAEDAKEYASRSSMHSLLVIFVQNLEKFILYDREFEDQLKAKAVVEEVWTRFDQDESGTIEWNELRDLIAEVMRWDENGHVDKPTDEEAKRFLKSMDTNGDGVLDKEEFTAFIVNALTMNVDLRIEFAQRSPMHAKLMVFVTNITERMWQKKTEEKQTKANKSAGKTVEE